MATPVKRSQYGFRVDGIEPRHDLAWQVAGPRGHLAFWREVARITLQVHDAHIARGLGRDGGPLRDISPKTRANRRSAMTPNGRGSPSAPPLTPGRRLSRTRSYMRALPDEAGVWVQWRWDRRTGMSWGQVLSYQARQGRDVLGLAFDEWDEVVRRGDHWWKRNRLRWAAHGAAQRNLDVPKVVAALHEHRHAKMPAAPRAPDAAPKPGTLVLDLPPAAVARPGPDVVRAADEGPLRGVVTSRAEADLVRASVARGEAFGGFRRGPGPASSGPFVRKPAKRRAR